MMPANVRTLIDECESIAGTFSSPEVGAEFARWLAIDSEDINARRTSVLLISAPEELPTLLPGIQVLQGLQHSDGAETLVLFDQEGTEMSRSFQHLGDSSVGEWGAKPHPEASQRKLLITDVAPTGIDGVRLLVAASLRTRLSAPEWAAFLRHYIDILVISPNATASGALSDTAASLGDSPALVLVLASKPVDSASTAREALRRCLWIASPQNKDLEGVLSNLLPGVLPLVLKHRYVRLLDGWRRELQAEGERLAAILRLRERALSFRPAAPATHGDEAVVSIRRTAQKVAESALSDLEAELAAAKFEASSEQIVRALDDDDLVWREATLEGARQANKRPKGLERVPRREFLLRVAPSCCDEIERKVAKATLEQLVKDARRIAKVLEEIEGETEERLTRIGERDSLPAPLELPRFPTLDAVAVRDEISVSAGNEEKLVRPGLVDIITLAQSGMNRVFGIIFSVLMLAGGAAFRRLPEVMAALLAILLGYVSVQWRRAPLLEARLVDEIKRKFKERITNSTETALRDSGTRRQGLHRQYLQKARKDLARYWEQLDAALELRSAHELSKSNANVSAASANVMHLKRNQVRLVAAVQHASQCISSLAQPADTAFRQLSGATLERPAATAEAASLRPVVTASVPHSVTLPFAPPPPRPASPPRFGFPGRTGVMDSLRNGGDH